jgi:predicted RNA-binding Zn-ribbon protein involved in translation (DUF1610 family)
MRDRNQKLDRLITETLPTILGHVQNFAETFRANHQQKPDASPQVQPPTLPPDVVPFTCVQCGQPLYYRQGWPGVICPTCGSTYEYEQEKTEPVATVEEADESTVNI